MKELKKELMANGLSSQEAEAEMGALREEMLDCIMNGDFSGAEDVLLYSGVDLDYIEELLF